ncbi:MAG: VCBS repeat-containing protein, partial [Candidatus Latescibacteria bacterium]|nr:VCBS repeat-containing protein [Candidatus Latescibacterota bacterium]
WLIHKIDDSLAGADGVRLLDVNGDGLMDITTGWEEGDRTRVYLNPGYKKARSKWPAVTVGETPSVEDAVFVDLDQDGAVDVVSSCEGKTQCMFVSWAPENAGDYLNSMLWKTEVIPTTQNHTRWMFALPMQIDGKYGPDLVVGSKNPNGLVGWLQAPADARDLDAWQFHKLYTAGWIMSLMPVDIDRDGDLDVVVSDRRQENRGVLWLENPGRAFVEKSWAEHRIGASGREVMFLDVADLNGDDLKDVVVAVKPDEIHWFKHPGDLSKEWQAHQMKVQLPDSMGTAKAVRVGDIDQDGRVDIVYSCEKAYPPKHGVVWLRYVNSPADSQWAVNEVSGPVGIKYDRIELLDMDGDNDLDVLTCEEHHEGRGLGVFWYENPLKH